jgi:hypothetical protein
MNMAKMTPAGMISLGSSLAATMRATVKTSTETATLLMTSPLFGQAAELALQTTYCGFR